MLRLTLALVAASAVAGCVNYKLEARIGPATMKFRHARLPSGALVVLEEARGTGAASVVMLVGAGSAQDPAGKEGLAHLVEHLSFRSKPAGTVSQWQAYELLGASSFNAATHFADTRIELVGQTRLMPALVSLAAQQLAFPVENIDPRVFEVERGVVRSELLERNERGYAGVALNAVQAAIFPAGHPFSRPMAGDNDTLGAITLDDARSWAAEHYSPSKVTLVVTGDFDADQIAPVVLAALPESWKKPDGQGHPPAAALVAPPDPPPAPAKLPVVRAATHENVLLLAWALPSMWKVKTPSEFFAIATTLALENKHEGDAPDVASIQCGIVDASAVAMLVCQARLLSGLNPEESLAGLRKRLDHMQQRDLRLRPHLLAELYVNELLQEENIAIRGDRRAEGAHYVGDPFALTQRITRLRQLNELSFDDVRSYLTADRMRAVLIEPADINALGAPRSPGVGEPSLDVNVPPEALRSESEGPALEGLRTFTLSNGLKVLVLPRPALPVAMVALVLPGGSSQGDRGAAWLSELYATEQADAAMFGGATTVTRQHDVTTVKFSGGNGNIEALLDNADSWLTESNGFQTIENERDDFDKQLSKRDVDASQRADAQFLDEIYRGTRAGSRIANDLLTQVTLRQADAWRAGAFQPDHAALIITGDIDPARMRDLAERHLGKWKATGPALPPLAAPSFEKKPTQVLVNGRTKSALVLLELGCVMPAPPAKDSLAPTVLSTLLRTRLEKLWRSELGVSYGVHATTTLDGSAAAIVVESQLDPRRLTTVLRTLKQQWDQLELPEHEIAMARWATARERASLGVTPGSLVEYFAGPAVRSQDLLGAIEEEHQLAELPFELLQKEFDVCKGTTVLRLDGDEELIRKALHDAGQ